MKHLKKFILILMVLALLPLSVFAADNTLSVFLTPEEEPLSGVSFRIYPVKDDVSDPQSAYMALLEAKTQAIATAITDDNGVANFTGLADGTYLLIGDAVTLGDKLLRPEMALVTLPSGTDREVDIFPKFSLTEKKDSVEYKLLKVWDDEKNPDVRPTSIQVDLYRNGEKKETVTLNAACNWRYSWTDTDDSALWAMIEQIPEHYSAEYRIEGYNFYIENIAEAAPTEPDPTEPDPTDPTEPDPTEPTSTDPTEPEETKPTEPAPTDPTEPEETKPTEPETTEPAPTKPSETPPKPVLPQTGQLWWPVPVLVLAGLALILVGLLRRKEQDYEV